MKRTYITLITALTFITALNIKLFSAQAGNNSNTRNAQRNEVHVKHVITLKKAIRMALKKNVQYQNALLDLEIAKMKVFEARSKQLPDITLSGISSIIYFSGRDDISTQYDSLFGGDSYNYALQLEGQINITMPIYAGGAITSGIELSKDGLKAKSITVDKIKKGLILSVKKSFYGIIIAREQLKVATESYKLNRANYQLAVRNFRQGLKPQYEMLQIQVTMGEARASMLNATHSLNKLSEELSDLIGINIKKPGTVIKGKLETKYLKIKYRKALRMAYANNNDIAITEMNYSIAKHQRKIEKSNLLPVVSLFVNNSFSHIPDTSLDLATFSAYRVGSKFNYSIMAGIRIDFSLSSFLYPRSVNAARSRMKAIDHQIRQNANKIKDIKDTIKLRLKVLYDQQKQLEKQIKLYENLMKVSRRNMNIATARYRTGNMDYLTMRNIEIQFINVRYQFNKYKFDYIINKTQILHEIGRTETVDGE